MSIDYPYSTEALEELDWSTIAPQDVLLADLTPTQADVSIARMIHHMHGGEPEAGDHHMHVVSHGDYLYVHDGHHRWLLGRCKASVNVDIDDLGWGSARVVDSNGCMVELDFYK